MNYTINHKAGVPAYLQLYDLLRKDIVTGVYHCGSRLPSKRTIAEETGLSVITVEHAMQLLCEEGYAEARQRSGCFVIFRESDFPGAVPFLSGQLSPGPHSGLPADRSHQLFPGNPHDRSPQSFPGNPHDSSLQASPGNPEDMFPAMFPEPAFPYTVLAKTMRRVLLDYGERILVKSPNRGCPELRNEICAYLARSRSIQISPAQVIIGSGAEYLYGLIAQMFGRGALFALELPSYDKIRQVYEAFGARCEMLRLSPDGISYEDLRLSRADVLHVTPFNSFPTGISVSVSKKYEYLRWAEREGRYIVEDNYDSELTVSQKAEDSLFSMSGGRKVIYVNTFSGTIAPSVRIGYMLLPEPLAERFNEKLGFYSCSVPVFEQYVLTELLAGGDYERNINRIRRKRRKMIQMTDNA